MRILFQNNLEITIPKEVLVLFHKKEQHFGDNESGGILLGKKELSQEKYLITGISLPSSKDISGSTYFIRNKDVAQQVINDSWIQSKGFVNYLGEWHTHCCKVPSPSHTDKQLISQIIEDKTSNEENITFRVTLFK